MRRFSRSFNRSEQGDFTESDRTPAVGVVTCRRIQRGACRVHPLTELDETADLPDPAVCAKNGTPQKRYDSPFLSLSLEKLPVTCDHASVAKVVEGEITDDHAVIRKASLPGRHGYCAKLWAGPDLINPQHWPLVQECGPPAPPRSSE